MKIVGNGLLASAFVDEDFGSDVVIFASGVSKSTETAYDQFKREKNLLSKSIADAGRLIYFSTCSVDGGTLHPSFYVSHKLEMEHMVLKRRSNTVIRLPQVVGKGRNGVTLVNFLAKKILNQEPYQIQSNTIRNIIDVDDVCRITKYILDENEVGAIHNCSMPTSFRVIEIVRQLEVILSLSSLHSEIPGEEATFKSSDIVFKAIKSGVLDFTSTYLADTISKYYSDFRSWSGDLK